jgi:hypothetical protein
MCFIAHFLITNPLPFANKLFRNRYRVNFSENKAMNQRARQGERKGIETEKKGKLGFQRVVKQLAIP